MLIAIGQIGTHCGGSSFTASLDHSSFESKMLEWALQNWGKSTFAFFLVQVSGQAVLITILHFSDHCDWLEDGKQVWMNTVEMQKETVKRFLSREGRYNCGSYRFPTICSSDDEKIPRLLIYSVCGKLCTLLSTSTKTTGCHQFAQLHGLDCCCFVLEAPQFYLPFWHWLWASSSNSRALDPDLIQIRT
jgi:hypothetical protein